MSKIITLFGSFRPKPDSPDYQLAYEMGQQIARSGFTLCNGGFRGTMEASAKGAKDAGGETIGITFSKHRLRPNPYIDRVEKKRTLLSRLERLVTLADGYLVFKGGTGTLLEISLVLEYTHKRFLSPRPLVFLGGYWEEVVRTAQREACPDPNLPFTAQAKEMGKLIRFVKTPEEAIHVFQEAFEKP